MLGSYSTLGNDHEVDLTQTSEFRLLSWNVRWAPSLNCKVGSNQPSVAWMTCRHTRDAVLLSLLLFLFKFTSNGEVRRWACLPEGIQMLSWVLATCSQIRSWHACLLVWLFLDHHIQNPFLKSRRHPIWLAMLGQFSSDWPETRCLFALSVFGFMYWAPQQGRVPQK